MKLKNLFLLLLFISMVIFNVQGQRYAKKHFTCFYYSLSIHEEIRNQMSALDSKVQINLDPKLSKIEALMVHDIYKTVTSVFSDSLEIFILPPNSLTDRAKYNAFGYPEITIQRALRLSDTKYFMKILASVNNDEYDNDGKKYQEGLFKPQVKITVEIYSKDGFNPIQVAEGFAEAIEPISLNASFIAGLDFADPSIKPEKASLKALIENAAIGALYSVKYTKPKK